MRRPAVRLNKQPHQAGDVRTMMVKNGYGVIKNKIKAAAFVFSASSIPVNGEVIITAGQ